MMRVVALETLVMLGLTAILAFIIITGHSHDRYFAETGNGKSMQMLSLPYPNMGRAAVSDWVAGAISQVMTFGFNDVDQRFAASRHLFTAAGWKSFNTALSNSSFVSDVMKTQQIVTSVPESVPILRQEGLIDGAYSWVFDMPLLVTFRAGANIKRIVANVRVVVHRVSPQDNPRALGISSWYISSG
ncbi:MAG: DotI/IcmL family type IV secretion protein [Alphaproteobacteria bacterium]|nr:DotI/IcmL family type IV secretion protein [Alphaproteobacteria bacterium]MDE2337068.1 DotI/IcmL family type IV secretion protein [Alphaproteobacteria bacterium]